MKAWISSLATICFLTGTAYATHPFGEDFRLFWIDTTAPSRNPVPASSISLVVAKKFYSKEDSWISLAKSEHIYPDEEAREAIRRLNPGIDSLVQTIGTNISFLRIQVDGKEAAGRLAKGELVSITLDFNLKDGFRQKLGQMALHRETLRGASTGSIGDPAKKTATLALLDSSIAILMRFKNIIENRTRTLPVNMIQQIDDQAGYLCGIMEKWAGSQTHSRMDLEFLGELEKDLKLKEAHLDNIRGPDLRKELNCKVVVKVVDEKGLDVNLLKVSYIERGFYILKEMKQIKSFGRLSSPSEKELAVANYRIWADTESPSLHCDTFDLELRKPSLGNTVHIDLKIRKTAMSRK